MLLLGLFHACRFSHSLMGVLGLSLCYLITWSDHLWPWERTDVTYCTKVACKDKKKWILELLHRSFAAIRSGGQWGHLSLIYGRSQLWNVVCSPADMICKTHGISTVDIPPFHQRDLLWEYYWSDRNPLSEYDHAWYWVSSSLDFFCHSNAQHYKMMLAFFMLNQKETFFLTELTNLNGNWMFRPIATARFQ